MASSNNYKGFWDRYVSHGIYVCQQITTTYTSGKKTMKISVFVSSGLNGKFDPLGKIKNLLKLLPKR